MIENGTAVTAARALSAAPVGIVRESRARSFLGRARTEYRIEWPPRGIGEVSLERWMAEGDLVIVPDQDSPGERERTFVSVVVESIARDFETGEFDDAEVSGEGIARAIRERYLM